MHLSSESDATFEKRCHFFSIIFNCKVIMSTQAIVLYIHSVVIVGNRDKKN
jgi:hypothetical protein